MLRVKNYEFWFVTGSQHLYGADALKKVEEDSKKIVESLNNSNLPFKIVFKSVLTLPEEIKKLCEQANSNENCAGIITWMHTFSPAKMWIGGLVELNKPMLHLHTQFNRDIPWDTLDMDFMNLNQSAHGDREYGFINARLRKPRKIVVGYYKDPEVIKKISTWMHIASVFQESHSLKVARFGDNMKNVAVTEGDKVEAEIKFGWSVDGYGIGDLVEYVNKVSKSDIDSLMDEYESIYDFSPELKEAGPKRDSVREQARIELGLKNFLEAGNYKAFTTNFEELHGMKQLPGLAAQHLMQEGYGLGPEGDWKTAALVHLMKMMTKEQGTSIMEDYVYNFESGKEMILGAHMLEVCPTLAEGKPRVEVHPLSIGGKEDPARLVFNGRKGPAICASLIDIGGRFRLIVNKVTAVAPLKPLPKLPVARVLWKPEPSLKESAEAWITAGGAHHTSFSYTVTADELYDLSQMFQIEFIQIDNSTNIRDLKDRLMWNDLAYKLL